VLIDADVSEWSVRKSQVHAEFGFLRGGSADDVRGQWLEFDE